MEPRPLPARQAGFTLIELSVVLAIVGVLIGGVLAGQYLIRQSQLQTISSDLTKFRGAYYQFKQQYGGMPGDILDATDYWGTDPNGCPTNAVTTTRKETCNGNGDSLITGASYAETFHAWQQLADAGFINGTFSGVTGTGGAYQVVTGQNAPAGRIPNTGYWLWSLGPVTGDSNTNYYNLAQSVWIAYGQQNTSSWNYGPVLTPREQSALDAKLDDGAPSTGTMLSFKSALDPNCTTSDVSGSAAYNLSYTSKACSFFYGIDQQTGAS